MIPHSRPWITEHDRNAVQAVLISEMIASGQLSKDFEKQIANKLDCDDVVVTSSGRAALILALKCLGISEGDEVIIPTYVCDSVRRSVEFVGASAVLCDSGKDWVVTPEQIAPVLSKNTAAIVAVHTFGMVADIKAIKKFGIPVIEDACQAFAIQQDGGFLGTQGDIGIASLSATKCMTTAEGGILICNSQNESEKARTLNVDIGISDVQAALGLSQLKRYDEALQRRKRNSALYNEALSDLKNVTLPRNSSPFLYRYVFKYSADSFEHIQAKFEAKAIAVRRGIDQLIHRQLGMGDEQFPNACELFNTTVSIPHYPALSEEELLYVCKTAKELLS